MRQCLCAAAFLYTFSPYMPVPSENILKIMEYILTNISYCYILTVLVIIVQLELIFLAYFQKGEDALININYRDSRPIYEQIKDGFRNLIASGILAEGERLPSVRELATQLAINPNTIQRAYRELEAEGCICSVLGKGSFASGRNLVLEQKKKNALELFKNAVSELRLLGIPDDDLIAYIRGKGELK